MDFNKFIDEIARKYSYNRELVEALKRCIPAMVKGKSEKEIEILMRTLERVQIFDFKSMPTQEEIDSIESTKLNGRNKDVKFIEADLGEYEKEIAPGAYCSTPVFDDNMNLVDRVRLYLYYKIK